MPVPGGAAPAVAPEFAGSPPAPLPAARIVSPHHDDVAFSCGAAFAALAAGGWEAHLVTVFARTVPDPRGFALECQTSKGLAPEVDYMAVRRAEDAAAARALGAASVRWLAHAEAPHRGYHSAPALFAGVHDADRDAWRAVADDLARLADELAPALVFAPQAVGALLAARAAAARPLAAAWYRDTPYVIRHPGAGPPEPLPDPDGPLADLALPEDSRPLSTGRKRHACAAYATQLGFQFGGPDGLARALDEAGPREFFRRAGAAGAAVAA